jgi:PAS domain S-box-containing protein
MFLKLKIRLHKGLLLFYLCIFIFNANTFSQNSINKYNNLKFEHLTVEDGLSQSSIPSIIEDKYGFIWFASWNGLNKYDGYRFTIYHSSNKNPKSLSHNRLVRLLLDKNGNLWAYAYDRMYNRYNYETDDFTRFTVEQSQNLIHDPLSKDPTVIDTGHIVYKNLKWENGSGNEFRQTDLVTGQIRKYKSNPSELWSINDNRILSIYLDDNKILWVGTQSGGVNKANIKAKPFGYYQHLENDKNSLVDNNIRGFYEDQKGLLWIGSRDSGITILDRKNNKFTRLQHSGNPYSLSYNTIRRIYCDKYGDIWVGTKGNGIDKYDRKTGRFKHYLQSSKNTDMSSWIFWISEDHLGVLWVGTFMGIRKYDRAHDKFVFVCDSLKNNKIRVIFDDSYHNLWVSTEDMGLIRLNRKYDSNHNEIFVPTYFKHNEEDNKSLSNNCVYSLCEDELRNLWIGTSVGLNKLNRQNNTFTHFTNENGLPDMMIVGILSDHKGNIWFSHKKGISKMNIYTNKIRNYSTSDGLQGLEFNEDAYYRSKSGEMFFGGNNGLNSFFPDSIKDDSYLPKVVFTDFQVLNQKVLIGQKLFDHVILEHSIVVTKRITLPYQANIFTIEFAALNYLNPKANKYTYMLEGFDKDWVYTDASIRRATYSNLEAKTYIFKVKGSNCDGVWNPLPNTLTITILPPWWKTWWFKALIWISILTLAAFLLYKFINQIKQAAHQTILNERNQIKTLINNIPDFIFIKDNLSRFLISNKSNVNLMGGKDEQEIIGKTDFDFYSREMAEQFFDQEQKIIKTGVPVLNEESSRQLTGGNTLYLSSTKCPIFSDKGEIIGLVGVVRDITLQKLAQVELLKQSEDLMHFNKVLNDTNVVLEERQQQIEEQSEELLARSENLKEANILLQEKQKLIQEQASQLTATNQKLSLLNSTKDKFFSIIAHDLRNPFNNVIGFAEILRRNYQKLPVEKIEKYLDLIYNSSTTGYNLLENLLLWSRAETGRISFDPVNINLLSIVKETLCLLEGDIHRKALSVSAQIEPDIVVWADENMIKTIFRNLISNAVKFTGNGGEITISAVSDNNKIEITVADTGVGIPEKIQRLLFKIDTNVSTKGTSNETGTGLGLILCREFVEKHKGTIWVESIPGFGSSFKFTLSTA